MNEWYRVEILEDLEIATNYVKWFDNFIHSSETNYFGSKKSIDEVLSPYNARYEPTNYCIEFKSEHDYIVFVLRWS